MKQRYSPDAELSVLGAVMLRNEVAELVDLQPDEFYDQRHRAVWEAMRRLRVEEIAIDPVTLETELASAGRLEAVGGMAFLCGLLSVVPTADNIAHYADIVRDESQARRLLLVCSQAATSLQGGADAEAMMSALFDQAQQIALRTKATAANLGELAAAEMLDTLRRAESRQGGASVSTLPTGLPELDDILGGIPIGVTTVIAGRPSMGKSSLARGIALHVARQGHGVHVFSIDDPANSYARRMLADVGRIDLQRLKAASILPEEARQLSASADRIQREAGSRILVDDSAGCTATQIGMRVRLERKRIGTKLVVVDFVQQVRGERGQDTYDRIAAISEAFHRLARKDGLAVILVSQLSRETERRENPRPKLADLRGAGELEQDAFAVLFPWRPAAYDKAADPSAASIIVAKHKDGSTGEAEVKWDAPTATFRSRPWNEGFRVIGGGRQHETT